MNNTIDFEIIIKGRTTRRVITQQTIRVTEELAADFTARIELMLALLPKKAQVTKTFKMKGLTIIEVELPDEPLLPPPATAPSFEQAFRRRDFAPKLLEAAHG